MDTILNCAHKMCASAAFIVALVLLDLPLKILAWIFLLVLGIILCIFYPLVKNSRGCNFLDFVYDYANSKQLIANWVWRQWQF